MNTKGGEVSALAIALVLSACGGHAAAAATAGDGASAVNLTAALNLASLKAAEAAVAYLQQTSIGQEPSEPALADPSPRRDINPYDRDIPMTVPLNFNGRVLGELPIVLTRDDRFIVESEGFRRLIDPLLTPEAQAALALRLAAVESFAAEEINTAGIRLDYDPEQLAVLILRIDPSMRSIERLFQAGTVDAQGTPPEAFSAYLNTNLSVQRLDSTGDVSAPSVFLNGALRYGRVVLEADVQGRDDLFTGEYSVERNYARFVYDQPEVFRRWYVGDLDPETRGRQGYVEMGGVGVARQRQRFDSFRNNILAGSRQLVLQEASTVRVLRNGVFYREFRLDPGQYDLSDLPLETGSNDIQIEIQGQSGGVESLSYGAYLDAIDLEPGDYEYGAFLGVISDDAFGSPDYSDGRPAFSGYWRKAFQDRPAIGVGLQASEDVQTLTGQTQIILRNGARTRVDGAVSNGPSGEGYAFALSYDHIVDRGVTSDNWTVVADYTSEHYTTIGDPFGFNSTEWIFTGSYSRQFSINWFGNLSASYRTSRSENLDDSYTVNATSTYRFNPQWSIQAGAELTDYGSTFGARRDGFGMTFALIWQPRFDRRADVRYSTARNSGSARYQQTPANTAGSLGYSVASTYDDGPATVSGQVDYIANRFDASLSHTAYGDSFSDVTDEQITTLRIGTSLAMAGGHAAVGRNIFDSFAIVYPHETLRGRNVIVGDNLAEGGYTGRSGALGGALANNLTAYIDQSIRYDVLNPPLGYNIGEGVARVRPTYKSGYAIEVGSAKFVSALGRLVGNDDRPVPLMSGRVRPADDPTAEPELFFTNSVGRFAVQNLEPSRRYRVELFSDPVAGFEFTVPADNEGLLDLQVVNVPLDVPED